MADKATRSYTSDHIGRRAERYAAIRLLLKGWWPVARRYKTPVGEIDLIMRRGNVLAFIEVKYRPDAASGLYALQPKQAQRLQRAAEHYLTMRPDLSQLTLRFDLVVITPRWGFQHLDNVLSQTT